MSKWVKIPTRSSKWCEVLTKFSKTYRGISRRLIIITTTYGNDFTTIATFPYPWSRSMILPYILPTPMKPKYNGQQLIRQIICMLQTNLKYIQIFWEENVHEKLNNYFQKYLNYCVLLYQHKEQTMSYFILRHHKHTCSFCRDMEDQAQCHCDKHQ